MQNKGRLPRAVGTENGYRFSRVHRKIHAIESRGAVLVPVMQIPNFDQRRH
jgi:hypothetical protein